MTSSNPIFKNNLSELFLGDTLEIMKTLKPESYDLIFSDPPYNLSNDGFTCQNGKMVSVNKGEWDKSKGFENDLAFHELWISECKKLLKPNGTLWVSGTYHSIFLCGYLLQKNNWHILNDIAWFKPNASPNLSCRMFTASHETLIWAKKSKKTKQTYNYKYLKEQDWGSDFIKKPNKQMRSVWVINTTPQREKEFGKHPTQKPEGLLERVILSSTNEGDMVLDPFCGSGTTGVVATKNNRVFTGIDNNINYLNDISAKRLT
jgi:site-specific DNA-methyltransferase (adenine-specific)